MGRFSVWAMMLRSRLSESLFFSFFLRLIWPKIPFSLGLGTTKIAVLALMASSLDTAADFATISGVLVLEAGTFTHGEAMAGRLCMAISTVLQALQSALPTGGLFL